MNNMSIACSVNECKYHSSDENYCTLDKIKVAKCDCNTCSTEDTECGSFQAKQQGKKKANKSPS